MPRPPLPRAKDVADLAKVLRAEGFDKICIESAPDGRVSITVACGDTPSNVTPLERWKAGRGSS